MAMIETRSGFPSLFLAIFDKQHSLPSLPLHWPKKGASHPGENLMVAAVHGCTCRKVKHERNSENLLLFRICQKLLSVIFYVSRPNRPTHQKCLGLSEGQIDLPSKM